MSKLFQSHRNEWHYLHSNWWCLCCSSNGSLFFHWFQYHAKILFYETTNETMFFQHNKFDTVLVVLVLLFNEAHFCNTPIIIIIKIWQCFLVYNNEKYQFIFHLLWMINQNIVFELDDGFSENVKQQHIEFHLRHWTK